MKKNIVTTTFLILAGSISSANQMTCYENHFNSAPIEYRKQQAQSVDRTNATVGFSMAAIMTTAGIGGFVLVKAAYPAQDTATNLSTAGAAMAAGGVVAGTVGEIILANVNTEYNELIRIRNLSDEAYLGSGKTIDEFSDSLVARLNLAQLKIKKPKTYNRELIKLSLTQVLVERPELCAFKDPSIVVTNLLSATVQRYNELAKK